MKPESFYWTTKSRKQIEVYHWPKTEPEMVVVLQHGFGEHAGRYVSLVDFFQHEHQAAVLANDRLGHGRSQGLRGHVGSIDQYLEEIDHLVQRAKNLYVDKPILLYGHSQGGMLVLRYVYHRPPDTVTGVIATAPWLRLAFDPPAWKIRLGKFMRNIWPSLQQASGLETKYLCTDPEVVAAYELDPLVHSRITPSAVLGIMDGGEELMARTGRAPVPVLIMHGDGDRITSMEASRQFADQNECVEFRSWPGLYHEIHHEPNKIEVLAYAGNWFERIRKPNREEE